MAISIFSSQRSTPSFEHIYECWVKYKHLANRILNATYGSFLSDSFPSFPSLSFSRVFSSLWTAYQEQNASNSSSAYTTFILRWDIFNLLIYLYGRFRASVEETCICSASNCKMRHLRDELGSHLSCEMRKVNKIKQQLSWLWWNSHVAFHLVRTS